MKNEEKEKMLKSFEKEKKNMQTVKKNEVEFFLAESSAWFSPLLLDLILAMSAIVLI